MGSPMDSEDAQIVASDDVVGHEFGYLLSVFCSFNDARDAGNVER